MGFPMARPPDRWPAQLVVFDQRKGPYQLVALVRRMAAASPQDITLLRRDRAGDPAVAESSLEFRPPGRCHRRQRVKPFDLSRSVAYGGAGFTSILANATACISRPVSGGVCVGLQRCTLAVMCRAPQADFDCGEARRRLSVKVFVIGREARLGGRPLTRNNLYVPATPWFATSEAVVLASRRTRSAVMIDVIMPDRA